MFKKKQQQIVADYKQQQKVEWNEVRNNHGAL